MRVRRLPIGVATLSLTLLLCCGAGSAAAGSVAVGSVAVGTTPAIRASLRVRLTPERRGAPTTIHFAFHVAASEGGLPPALTRLTVGLPAGMGIEMTGIARCTASALRAHGTHGCPADAQVGDGKVEVQVPLGEKLTPEHATLTVFHGPSQDGRARLLFLAVGRIPIATRLVFSAVIDPSGSGASIRATIPLIPTLPDSPDAAIVSLSSSLGTLGRAYYRTVHGHRSRFTPGGVTVPDKCPAGGLPFSATFGFEAAAGASARATVACS